MSKRLFTRRPARGAWGLLYNPGAWWLGVHYSPHNRRYCINLIPCLTLWVMQPGGNEP